MRKNAEILKNASQTDEDMELINQYTRRVMNRDEVYTFSVVLCDNEIDRDFERFTEQSLYSLEKLFLGKTGVFDHNPKAENQTARIYSLAVEKPAGRKTSVGDDYCRLVAKAYMPRSEKTNELILMLDSGIQKEVSVGCAVSRSICSVCGKENGSCSHEKGKSYNGKLCYYELSEPYDAYEWSFVAVPAQRNAGVIKAYKANEGVNMKEILKALGGGALNLNAHQSASLKAYISKLEEQAQDGARYKASLAAEVKLLAVKSGLQISSAILDGMLEKMSVSELCACKTAYEKQRAVGAPVKPQLASKGGFSTTADNNTFII